MTLDLQTFNAQLDEHKELSPKFMVVGQSSPKKLLTDWKSIFGNMEPRTVYQRIARATPNPLDTAVLIDVHHGYAEIKIQHKHELRAPNHGLSFSVTKEKGALRATVLSATLLPPYSNRGIGTAYIREAISLLKDIGATRIGVNAGDQLGGYAWAKYGFQPTAVEIGRLQKQVAEMINGTNLSYTEFDPATMQRVSKTYDIAPELAAIQSILALPPEKAAQGFAHFCDLSRVVDDSHAPPLTVGKAILLQTSWKGEMALQDDSPGYARFKTYTNSLRTQERMQA